MAGCWHILTRLLSNCNETCNTAVVNNGLHVAIFIADKSGGSYHSTKILKFSEKGKNLMEISWEKFQTIQELLNFRKENH